MEGRTYRYFKGTPQYPFGFGLSYTTFAYGQGKLSKSSVKAGKGVKITVPVQNTGNRAGTEVVQVYVKALDNPDAPIKALKGFQRVSIDPGKTESVTIDIAPDAFAYYDGNDGVAIKPGKYQILYGSSSAEQVPDPLRLLLRRRGPAGAPLRGEVRAHSYLLDAERHNV